MRLSIVHNIITHILLFIIINNNYSIINNNKQDVYRCTFRVI